jgi:hypothetical protein
VFRILIILLFSLNSRVAEDEASWRAIGEAYVQQWIVVPTIILNSYEFNRYIKILCQRYLHSTKYEFASNNTTRLTFATNACIMGTLKAGVSKGNPVQVFIYKDDLHDPQHI